MITKPEHKPLPSALAGRLKAIADGPALEASVYCDVSSRTERQKRDAVFKPASAVLQAGENINVVLKNISVGGARIEFFHKHVLSDRLYVLEPTLPLHIWARVMWQEDGAAGIMFIQTPTPDEALS